MSGSGPADLFLGKLESFFGKEPTFYKGKPAADGGISPSVLVFANTPGPGKMTCVTYGLSIAPHEKWTMGRRPELIMTVESSDPLWAIELADLVAELRGQFPFSYGQRINLGRKIGDTNVSCFLVFAPLVLNKEQYLDLDIGLDYKLVLTGIYPLVKGESDIVDMIGLEEFLRSRSAESFMNVRK